MLPWIDTSLKRCKDGIENNECNGNSLKLVSLKSPILQSHDARLSLIKGQLNWGLFTHVLKRRKLR